MTEPTTQAATPTQTAAQTAAGRRYKPGDPAACLWCPADGLTLVDGGVVPEHEHAGEPGQPCPGAGHTRRWDDGHDGFRRYALSHFVQADDARANAEAEVHAALKDPKRDAASVTRREMAVLIHWEVLARLWRNFVVHGRWDHAVRDCLKIRVYDITSSSAIGHAVVQAKRGAAKAWWQQAHLELLCDFAVDGPTAEQFNNMMMGV